ncbi:hypothetical protein Cgig2_030000 [Carnegiea gigantea]|uniref:F-box/LRR-repeat protein 15/At3g58940/PEG3-like LRR domain-containing protein n=1 Tax=Carnegiea gigantea TaxID=171969 RepID=A0A9Q1K6Y8_9CARY|nr:hypothetical protein Cgig2_030000 [Carnegiea gigantea]
MGKFNSFISQQQLNFDKPETKDQDTGSYRICLISLSTMSFRFWVPKRLAERPSCPRDGAPLYFIKKGLDAERNLSLWENHPEWFDEETKDEYLSFIETTMQNYSLKSLSIRKLTVKVPACRIKWRSCLSPSFSIVLEDSINYRLPAIIFSAKSLKSLSCSRVEIPYYDPSKLISLQCLSLYDVTMEETVLQHIINACPLDRLLLKRCYSLKSILIPHFSKLKMLEFWRKVETGGTINVESSNLVRLCYYSCNENYSEYKMEPSWPWNIHATLSNLRSLQLCGAAIRDETLAKLLPGLALLEILTLCSRHLLENIRIHGVRLKELALNDCDGLADVTVDTPNLCMLCYSGDPDIILVTTNIPPRCKVYFPTVPEAFNTNWFIRWKKLLVESNICRILSIWMPSDVSMIRFNEEKAGKISLLPPYKLEELRISLPLSTCHPDQLSILVTLGDPGSTEAFTELLKKRVECLWHPLTRIEVTGADCSALLYGAEKQSSNYASKNTSSPLESSGDSPTSWANASPAQSPPFLEVESPVTAYLRITAGRVSPPGPPLFVDFTEEQIKDHFDDDVRRIIMEMESSCEALVKLKMLKEEGNKLLKTKDYRLAIITYEKAMQFLCVSVSLNENEATLMKELAIAINLNIAACWLKLLEFELAKQQSGLIMKLDPFNVKVHFRRAQALLQMGLKDQAHQDILNAIRYEPIMKN